MDEEYEQKLGGLRKFVQAELARGVIIEEETAYIWRDFVDLGGDTISVHDVFMEIIRCLQGYKER